MEGSPRQKDGQSQRPVYFLGLPGPHSTPTRKARAQCRGGGPSRPCGVQGGSPGACPVPSPAGQLPRDRPAFHSWPVLPQLACARLRPGLFPQLLVADSELLGGGRPGAWTVVCARGGRGLPRRAAPSSVTCLERWRLPCGPQQCPRQHTQTVLKIKGQLVPWGVWTGPLVDLPVQTPGVYSKSHLLRLCPATSSKTVSTSV